MLDPLLKLVPSALRPIAEELGYAAVLRVAHALGGRREYIPRRPRLGNRLERAIGVEALAILRQHHACIYLEIPRAWRLRAAIRAAAVQADTRSLSQVAETFGITERHVRNLRYDAPRRRLPKALVDAARELWPE